MSFQWRVESECVGGVNVAIWVPVCTGHKHGFWLVGLVWGV